MIRDFCDPGSSISGPRAARPTSRRLAARVAYLLGMILVLGSAACSRTKPPAEPQVDETPALREQIRSLELKVSDLENERDRLREKLEARAEASSEPNPKHPDDPGSDAAAPSEGALPVVKLAPEPARDGAAPTASGEEAPRPILRAYGEEEGRVILDGEADVATAKKSPVAKKPTAAKPAPAAPRAP